MFGDQLISLQEYTQKAKGKGVKKGIAFERDGQKKGVRRVGSAVATAVSSVGGVISKAKKGVEKQSRHIYTHVKMSARWIGKVVAMLGKYLNNGHKCLIPVPESANVMEIIEMMQQILETASVVAMPFKVSLEKLMQKMLKSLGLMVRFPMQEFERVEKIFPEGLMGDLVEASKSGKGVSALHDNFKSLRSNLRQFLTSANLSMPRRVKEILGDLVGDGADLSKFVSKEGLAPDQTGMETKPIDSPAKSDDSEVEDFEDSKEQLQKSNDDLKTELEKQITDCRQQVDALEKAQASKSEICGKLAGKLKKACETRLDSRTPVMIRNLKKQCRALDDIYGQNFVEIAEE